MLSKEESGLLTSDRVSATSTKRRKRDKEASKKALVEAAIKVFSEMGYDAATTREIAKRAKISEALIQRYFDGKSGLLLEVIRVWMIENEKNRISSMPLADNLRAELEQLVRFSDRHNTEQRDVIRVSISRAIVDRNLASQIGKVVLEKDVPAVEARLMHFKKLGQIKESVNLKEIAHAILSSTFVLGFIGADVFGFDKEHMNSVAATVAELIAKGLTEDAKMGK